jgi:phosphoglucosamine mutase
MRKLFGTDGIRAVAGEFPLDALTIAAVGKALGHQMCRHAEHPRALIGADTRESSSWIADTLAQGLKASGAEIDYAGVLTTPGVAHLTHSLGYQVGIVISASHNPWRDNGIKIFGHDGYKLADSVELEIETEIFSLLAASANSATTNPPPSRLIANPQDAHQYITWLRSQVPSLDLTGWKIVLDCANGAASHLAPPLFHSLGADIVSTHASPNGRNINENCGALHPEVVARETANHEAALGITFDGDADRALFANARGEIVNGDGILLLLARHLLAQGKLAANTVVATTMSNMGLEAALQRSGIRMLRAPVGDKYVLEEMRRSGAVLGGEQSGHIIFLDRATTGDGLLSALVVADILSTAGKPLHELIGDLVVYPQVIQNVRVAEKPPLDSIPTVAQAIRSAESALSGRGRVVVRYSGTEKLCRVMIEAEDEAAMRDHTARIIAAIQSAIGTD